MKNFPEKKLLNYLIELFGSEHNLVITSITYGILYVSLFNDPSCIEDVYKRIVKFYIFEVKSKKNSDEIKKNIKNFLSDLNMEIMVKAELSRMISLN